VFTQYFSQRAKTFATINIIMANRDKCAEQLNEYAKSKSVSNTN